MRLCVTAPYTYTDENMNSNLVDIERKALRLRNNGQLKEAAELFAVVVKDQPDWEHGTGFYNLACCYEDLGELASAEECYRDALRYEPKNPYFIGGLASFLYLHGDTDNAFTAYLTLLEVERAGENQRGIEAATTALQSLGKKMGLLEEALSKQIGAAKN